MNKGMRLSENSSYKIVALLITLILWITIIGSKEAVTTKRVRVEYLLSRDTMITNNVPLEVEFRLGGSRLFLKKYSETNEPLSLDLTLAPEGTTTVRVHPDSINVPNGIRVLNVQPSTISAHVERVLTKKVPVEFRTVGKLPEGKRIVQVTVIPDMWEVSGARSAIESLKSLKTEPFDLSDLRSSLTRELALPIEMPGLVKQEPAKVKVALVVK